ncbi:MAG: hypothetical protein U0I48_02400 [Acutalibacteraceae bacterium]|nr:hypothetical protein [Acutalibacteraceae bacterium]
MMNPRTGRPKSANPKSYEVKARIDQSTNNLLEQYCKENHLTKTDVVRAGLELVLSHK